MSFGSKKVVVVDEGGAEQLVSIDNIESIDDDQCHSQVEMLMNSVWLSFLSFTGASCHEPKSRSGRVFR
jgi:hypothetical protein